jgi:ubiquinone biosynthesis protein COQ4
MPSSPSTRLHPIAAFRAMRALTRDREDTKQAFLLIDALRGKTTLRLLARFRRTETGRAVLAEQRRLLDRLVDRRALAALPAGTLGRAYYDFMAEEHLSAEGLVEASRVTPLPAATDMALFRERTREMHDLLHVITGYGREPLGESCVIAFSFAQTGQKGFAVIAAVSAHRIARARPGFAVRRAVFEAYRRGRRAGWLIGADWENLLAQPLMQVRAQFGVEPAPRYTQVIATLRAQSPAAAPPMAVAA